MRIVFRLLPLLISIFVLSACSSDEATTSALDSSNSLKGYSETVDDKQGDIEKAQSEVQKELEDAQNEVLKAVEDAQKEINGTVGEMSGELSSTISGSKDAMTNPGKDDRSNSNDTSYEKIYDEYKEKLEDKTPVLIEEYNREAADHNGDVSALAELSNDKVQILAEINNEGVEKMAELMWTKGDDYKVYEEWAEKLTDVYMAEGEKITDTYMDSFGL